ncbi:MAG: hypothetical protein UV61_C0009G0074 [Candidatus Gottesmanbacteria bacterium GW2011_GWB1_43_11]|uniref:Uncharacterized protein n=1 Tax=Candidatus Gottesmanbacteria bacterium GW2011_GWB1_43_11 TaxID=1618446 RepID=A0A0G1CM09_9BACT|nr:MAG: hypothetical protein UV61_C0009G0074 [Candidatus Gottesmanbacteria bacterium GW2011_GWB1_43_11]
MDTYIIDASERRQLELTNNKLGVLQTLHRVEI